MQANNRLSIVLACLCFLLAGTVQAQPELTTLAQLQQSERLRIKTWVEPSEIIYARQQVKLQIEISTDKWFTGGTRIRLVDVENAIVLQRENFAVNSTLVEGETTWTVQLWTLVVYPQSSGVVEIPAIQLRLSIAGEDSQSIVGDLATRPFSFVAKTPATLSDTQQWVATNRFEVEQQFSRPVDQLQAGDALIRTITLSADNLPAMMLPKVVPEKINGIAVYQKPAKILDKVNRGEYLAQRTEEISYVFEKVGQYVLPAQTFYWWNIQSQSLESIELEAVSLNAGAVAVGPTTAKPEPVGNALGLVQLVPLWLKVIIGLFIALIVYLLARGLLRRKKQSDSSRGAQLTAATLVRDFQTACAQKEFESALALLYQWLDRYGGESFKGSVREQLNSLERAELSLLFDDLTQSIYHKDDCNGQDLKRFAKQYIGVIRRSQRAKKSLRSAVELKLN